MPAGRLAIQGGGSPDGGAGSETPGLTPNRMKAGNELVVRKPCQSLVLQPDSLLRGTEVPGSRPGRLEEREAREPVRVRCNQRERGGAPARVPDEMEAPPAARLRLAEHAGDLELEAVVLGRLRRRVDLEILRDSLDLRLEGVDQRAVRGLCREHDPRKQDHPKRRQGATCLTSGGGKARHEATSCSPAKMARPWPPSSFTSTSTPSSRSSTGPAGSRTSPPVRPSSRCRPSRSPTTARSQAPSSSTSTRRSTGSSRSSGARSTSATTRPARRRATRT